MLGCLRQAICLDLRTVSRAGELIEAGGGGEGGGGGIVPRFLIRLPGERRWRKIKMEEEEDRAMERERGSDVETGRNVLHTQSF